MTCIIIKPLIIWPERDDDHHSSWIPNFAPGVPGAWKELAWKCPPARVTEKNIKQIVGLKAWEVSTLPETNIAPENDGFP